MIRKRAFFAVLLVPLGVCFGAVGTAASMLPAVEPVKTLNGLVQWYESEAGGKSSAMLADELLVEDELLLAETDTVRDIGAIEHVLRVGDGGVLILDNPNLTLQGPETVVVVEEGGWLQLCSGSIYTGPGKSVIVETGGKITRHPEFQLIGGEIWVEEEQNNSLPGLPEPTAKPDENPPIEGVIGDSFTLFCPAGKPPEDYPAEVTVFYQKTENVYEQTKLPIDWQLDAVDFDTPGTYEVNGSFDQEDLDAKGLSNPENFGAVLLITVQKRQPIDTMTGRFVRVGAQGDALVQLSLPALPEDTEALYLYCSVDGINWEQASGKDAQEEFTDFLPFSQQRGLCNYVNYRFQSNFRDIWLKAQVVGSIYEGYTNAICVEIPADAKPGTIVAPGSDPDDGSLDGNRGGGGQNEGDRELPTPAPDQDAPQEDRENTLHPEPSATPVPKEGAAAESKPEPGPESTPRPQAQPVSAEMQSTENSIPVKQGSRGVLTVAAVTLGALAVAALGGTLAYFKKKGKGRKHG